MPDSWPCYFYNYWTWVENQKCSVLASFTTSWFLTNDFQVTPWDVHYQPIGINQLTLLKLLTQWCHLNLLIICNYRGITEVNNLTFIFASSVMLHTLQYNIMSSIFVCLKFINPVCMDIASWWSASIQGCVKTFICNSWSMFVYYNTGLGNNNYEIKCKKLSCRVNSL